MKTAVPPSGLEVGKVGSDTRPRESEPRNAANAATLRARVRERPDVIASFELDGSKADARSVHPAV
jgi:hypothetical protein